MLELKLIACVLGPDSIMLIRKLFKRSQKLPIVSAVGTLVPFTCAALRFLMYAKIALRLVPISAISAGVGARPALLTFAIIRNARPIAACCPRNKPSTFARISTCIRNAF